MTDAVMELVGSPIPGLASAAVHMAAASAVVPLIAPPSPPETPDSGSNDRRPDPEKLTVNLAAAAAEALHILMEETGETKTVVTNRALQYLRILRDAVAPDQSGRSGHIILVSPDGRRTRELTIVI